MAFQFRHRDGLKVHYSCSRSSSPGRLLLELSLREVGAPDPYRIVANSQHQYATVIQMFCKDAPVVAQFFVKEILRNLDDAGSDDDAGGDHKNKQPKMSFPLGHEEQSDQTPRTAHRNR